MPPDAGQPPKLVPAADVCPAAKHIVVMRFDIVEDRAIQLAGSRDGAAPVPSQKRNTGAGLGVEPAIPRDLKAHQGTPAIVDLAGCEILLPQSKGRQVVQRDIQPPETP